MKIATWNVNSLTARWGRVEAWLATKSPDVVLIQETKQNDVKFPAKDLAALGYESAHYGQGQWNGVAVFSKVGIEDVVAGFGDDDHRGDLWWRARDFVLRAQWPCSRQPPLRLQARVAREASRTGGRT